MRQISSRTQQHRAVPRRQHETIAVPPVWVGRVVLEEIIPQHLGNVRHTHGHAGMAGIGLLNGVHGQGANRVGKLSSRRHQGSLVRLLGLVVLASVASGPGSGRGICNFDRSMAAAARPRP